MSSPLCNGERNRGACVRLHSPSPAPNGARAARAAPVGSAAPQIRRGGGRLRAHRPQHPQAAVPGHPQPSGSTHVRGDGRRLFGSVVWTLIRSGGLSWSGERRVESAATRPYHVELSAAAHHAAKGHTAALSGRRNASLCAALHGSIAAAARRVRRGRRRWQLWRRRRRQGAGPRRLEAHG